MTAHCIVQSKNEQGVCHKQSIFWNENEFQIDCVCGPV